jgi:hypothetical protein
MSLKRVQRATDDDLEENWISEAVDGDNFDGIADDDDDAAQVR